MSGPVERGPGAGRRAARGASTGDGGAGEAGVGAPEVRTAERRVRAGYSLVEVVVAVALLQVGLLGVAGMLTTAARIVGEAARLERALSLAEAVADSLQATGWTGPGERLDGGWEVRWSGSGGRAEVEVRLEGDAGEALVRLPVPVREP